MQLPLKLTMDLMQTRWKSLLDPILENPINSISIIDNVALVIGNNVINHRLGRKQQGWLILDIDAASTIYRSADFNDKTLTLNASAAATIKLGVF
jgi:hypothetical protein